MLDYLAIKLLGLEPSCYEAASAAEKRKIQLVLFAFSAVLALSLVSMYLTGLFISGRHVAAFFIGILGSFVLISIFRFSLILIKPRIVLLDQLNETVIQTTFKEKWQRLKGLFTRAAKLRFNGDMAVPGFTLVFRFLYLGLLAFVLIFPLTILLNWTSMMDYNQELRDDALRVYRETEQSHASERNKTIDSGELQQRMSWYERKVSREYFTMKLYTRAAQLSTFKPVTILVIFLFIFPHLALFGLMRNKKYTYVTALNAHFKKKIESDFEELKSRSLQIIRGKGHAPEKHDLSFLSKGNPYLTPNPESAERKNISFKEWQVELKKAQVSTNTAAN